VPVTIVVYDVKAYHSVNGGARKHESVERERNADRDVTRPGLGGLKPPPNVILAPHPNEFQPMKYPGLAKSAQMYGGSGLTAGNKPTYG